MKNYIREHRALLLCSAAILAFCALLVGSMLLVYPVGEQPPDAIKGAAIGAVILSTLTVFANIFAFIAWMLGRMQLGFQRLGLVILPAAAVVLLFNSFIRVEGEFGDYSWYWRSDTNAVDQLLEGLFWTLTYSAVVALSYVALVGLTAWIAEGFRQSDRG
ncbi:hypothetical protein [Hyphomicrobium sp. CS1BSMeth3]|uniref:hypothetical protein n=1 Tax=Hyphomicrobium sp. CS1BSMeth3 TaxID=1892844 RepID=UPI0009317BCE|nr:hypothetical protein [Hyphomicrobium sp. CS1BSMeth3]